MNVENLMEQVEEGLRKEGPLIYILPKDDFEANIQELNALWTINTEITPLPTRPGLRGKVTLFAKRLIRKSLRWYIRPLADEIQVFHAAVVRTANDVATKLDTLQANIFHLKTMLESERTHFSQQLRQVREEALERGEELTERIAKVERLLRSANSALRNIAKDESLSKEEVVERGQLLGLDYRGFEDRYRGSESLIRKRQSVFVKYFERKKRVVDLGSGRGEFLELLKDKSPQAYGVDVDPSMVDYCLKRGLRVIEADLISHLQGLKDKSLDGIFSSQVIEHLKPPELLELVELCYHKLKPDSYLVLETVNPLCLSVFARSFYLDLSHQKPIHPEFIKYQLESLNFRDVEIIFSSPIPAKEKLAMVKGSQTEDERRNTSYQLPVPGPRSPVYKALNENFKKLNDLLFSYQDYAVVARK